MQFHLVSFFAVLFVIVFNSTPALADCCPTNDQGYCDDGSQTVTCCGNGNCNIFCGNCYGGCRAFYRFPGMHSGDPTESAQCSRSAFQDADADKDGRLNFAEWVVYSMPASKRDKLAARWYKFDYEKKWYLTEEEAFQRTAA